MLAGAFHGKTCTQAMIVHAYRQWQCMLSAHTQASAYHAQAKARATGNAKSRTTTIPEQHYNASAQSFKHCM